MAIALLETLATDLLENENLVGFNIILENSSLNDCALYVR